MAGRAGKGVDYNQLNERNDEWIQKFSIFSCPDFGGYQCHQKGQDWKTHWPAGRRKSYREGFTKAVQVADNSQKRVLNCLGDLFLKRIPGYDTI